MQDTPIWKLVYERQPKRIRFNDRLYYQITTNTRAYLDIDGTSEAVPRCQNVHSLFALLTVVTEAGAGDAKPR